MTGNLMLISKKQKLLLPSAPNSTANFVRVTKFWQIISSEPSIPASWLGLRSAKRSLKVLLLMGSFPLGCSLGSYLCQDNLILCLR